MAPPARGSHGMFLNRRNKRPSPRVSSRGNIKGPTFQSATPDSPINRTTRYEGRSMMGPATQICGNGGNDLPGGLGWGWVSCLEAFNYKLRGGREGASIVLQFEKVMWFWLGCARCAGWPQSTGGEGEGRAGDVTLFGRVNALFGLVGSRWCGEGGKCPETRRNFKNFTNKRKCRTRVTN